MKRIISSIIICAFLLCGCSNSKSSSSESENGITSNSAQTTQSASQSAQTTVTEAPAANVNLDEIYNLIISSGEWASMYVPDEAEFSEYFGFEMSDPRFESVYGAFCPMSAVLSEVLLVVPKSGSEEEALQIIENRKTLLIEKYAYYPSDKIVAEEAKLGKVGNVYYLICSTGAETAENALLEQLG